MSSSSLLSLDYLLNTDEPKIFTCNQDSCHAAWTPMSDHLLLSGYAPSCPGHCVCYSCYLGPIPFSLNLLNTICHSGWKSLFLQLKCTFLFLVSTNTPYTGLGDTPPSVFTWLREVLNEGEKSISCI